MLIIRGAVQSHYDPSGAGDDSPDRWLRRAARYALRASRSVVVSLSLSRRNAASESKKTPAAGRSSQNYASLTSYIYWLTVRGGTPFGRPLRNPNRGIFYELRVTRSDVVNLNLSRRNAASVGDVLLRRPATR